MPSIYDKSHLIKQMSSEHTVTQTDRQTYIQTNISDRLLYLDD